MSQPRGALARIPAGVKFAVLFGAGIALYLITSWQLLTAALAIAVAALLLAREPMSRLLRPLAGLLIMVGFVMIMTRLSTGPTAAVIAGLRLLTLCLVAYAVTLSTRFTETLGLFERVLAPTERIGLNPAKIGLALALTVRFIPELRQTYARIREAQYARGLQNRPVATLVPMVISALQTAEQVAEAIDARAYDTNSREIKGEL